jgi:DNA-binding NtrC family response regulator
MTLEKQPHILVIDDEEEIREVIIESISGQDYLIFQAEDASKALEIIAKEPIDIALIDIAMPGMSGIELIQKLQIERPLLTAMMVTAFGNKDLIKEALKAGAFDFIEKPFDPNMLLNRIQKAIEHHEKQRINELIIEEFLLSYSPNITKEQFDKMDMATRKRVLAQGLTLIRLKQSQRDI